MHGSIQVIGFRTFKQSPTPSCTNLKTSNHYVKTGFLFCTWQIGKVEHKQVAPCYRLKTRILAAIPFYSFPADSYFWPISLLPLNYRHNFSRLIMPPMYRSSELRPKPIDGLEPPTYRLQGDCTAIVLYRLNVSDGARTRTLLISISSGLPASLRHHALRSFPAVGLLIPFGASGTCDCDRYPFCRALPF